MILIHQQHIYNFIFLGREEVLCRSNTILQYVANYQTSLESVTNPMKIKIVGLVKFILYSH